ncbi:hypothetical protein EDC94DRAFT_592225 [Helicostylum pulchrum]|nr:hypothetical protein EDC94DRAFT_592225 [Helicostylum pulchrum]
MSPFYEEQPIIRRSVGEEERRYIAPTTSSRTQHKLQLQRLFVLTNDKNYLDHPKNMRRLTKELDRVNREYRCVRRFEDPVQESFRRLGQKVACEKSIHNNKHINRPHTTAATSIRSQSHSSSSSSSNSSSYSSSAEQNSFIGRWFAHQENDHTNPHSIIDTNSVVYSFHPTIANSMKRKTKH